MVVASALYGAALGVDATIDSENYPLPRTADEMAKEQTLDRVGFALSFSIMFGLAPLASSVVIFVVHETATKSKHLQFVSSVNPLMYWASTFAHDFCVYIVGALGSLILFPMFGFEAFLGERFGVVMLL
jgi:ATP-binding cassette subfamily A (ABC1) protein 3